MDRRFPALPALVLAAVVTGFAPSPQETEQAMPEPDVRLVYESDTRGYYRPCG